MTDPEASIFIGLAADYIRIDSPPALSGRSVDEYRWRPMVVTGRSGEFHASTECLISNHDLSALHVALLRLANATVNESWRSTDGEVSLQFIKKTLGHIDLKVEIRDFGQLDRRLNFSIEMDQSYLGKIIDDVSNMMTTDQEQ